MPVPPDWSQQVRAVAEQLKSTERTYKDHFPKFVLTEQAVSWDNFLGWLNELQGSWGFRGQREAEWSLDTSLDREVKVQHSSQDGSSVYHLDREKADFGTLKHQFQAPRRRPFFDGQQSEAEGADRIATLL